MSNSINLFLLSTSFLLVTILSIYLMTRKNKSQIQKVFLANLILGNLWTFAIGLQLIFTTYFDVDPFIFEYFTYIGASFLPVSILFTGIIFAKTNITFRKKYILLFVPAILSLLILWTNNFHHLFYEHYSILREETIYGIYSTIYLIYSYSYIAIGLALLMFFSIKNSGFFSRQSLLLFVGALIPVLVNVLFSFDLLLPATMSVYLTPISFSIGTLIWAFAILKFQLFNVIPIALQNIVDRISDGYIVIAPDCTITDYNKTFINIFSGLITASKLRNKNIFDIIDNISGLDINPFILKNYIDTVQEHGKIVSIDKEISIVNKVFTIEITGIVSHNNNYLGTLILLKDITQHIKDLQVIQENQNILMEKDRLASLGQLIGGIAHNLKTPIMSIAGASEGLLDLINEYELSIKNTNVTIEDHCEISKEMKEWVEKIKVHDAYMSDVITAVKGQAVTLNTEHNTTFTIDELVKRIDILMKHELKHALITLNLSIDVPYSTILQGDVSSLIQVIDNMITNAIQAYDGKQGQCIDFSISKKDSNIVISIQDFAKGMSKEVKNKLFKEMITTKGKNGTGLGLYMSYSTIKGKFNGNITFESELGKGTTFHIWLPV